MDWTLVRGQSEGMIFSAFCQEAGKEVLLGPDNFVDLRHGAEGFELQFSCHCGRLGVVRPARSGLAACGGC